MTYKRYWIAFAFLLAAYFQHHIYDFSSWLGYAYAFLIGAGFGYTLVPAIKKHERYTAARKSITFLKERAERAQGNDYAEGYYDGLAMAEYAIARELAKK